MLIECIVYRRRLSIFPPCLQTRACAALSGGGEPNRCSHTAGLARENEIEWRMMSKIHAKALATAFGADWGSVIILPNDQPR
jgi:hypothetical protein